MSSFTASLEDDALVQTYAKLPLKVVRGEGPYVWTDEGKKLIDFSTGYGVALLGHCPQPVVEAVKLQLQALMVCHGSLYNDAREKFLGILEKAKPKCLDRAFICNSGAEAVESALKLAVKKTGKKGIVSFQGAYHGKTLGALSVTWGPKYREAYSDILLNVKFAKYGTASSVGAMIDEDTAAVIVEPVQGEAGVRIPPPEFLPELQEECRRKGILLIVDEVQTGLGRTGGLWAHERSAIEPDIMCFGKGLASGVPVGCMMASDVVAGAWSRGEHTTTFGGNPLSSAAAAATLETILGERLWVNAAEKGQALGDALRALPKDKVREVRGLGLMIALETRMPSLSIMKDLLGRGLLAIPTGVNVIRFLPPINLERAVLEEAVNTLKESFEGERT